jgi:hypothetical protein
MPLSFGRGDRSVDAQGLRRSVEILQPLPLLKDVPSFLDVGSFPR